MPRVARLDFPGALHHVMARGIERRAIFADDDDRRAFVERLGDVCTETGTPCFAWVAMPNHIHLLTETAATPLGRFMHALLLRYSSWFNRRHKRSGHLFQNRYRSTVVEADPYFLTLVRYIHVNPFRGGLVHGLTDLDRFPWSGHRALLGRAETPWQDRAKVWRLLARSPAAGPRAYRTFVAAGLDEGPRPDLMGGGARRSARSTGRGSGSGEVSDARVLGDGEFVTTVLTRAGETPTHPATAARAGWTPHAVLALAATRAGIEPPEVLGPGKRPAECHARALACRWLVSDLGLTTVAAARLLEISQSAVSLNVRRGRTLGTRARLPASPASR